MENEQISTFAKRLDYLISQSGRSASSIARDLKVSKQTISAWQTGTRTPKYPTMVTMAQYFSVDQEWLMGFGAMEDFGKSEDLASMRLLFGTQTEKRFEAARLGYVMEQSNCTIEDLISRCDFIPPGEIQAIFEGRQEPSDGQVLAFSAVLGIDSAFLFGIANEPMYFNKDTANDSLPFGWADELVGKFAAAPELIQQAICDILKIKPYTKAKA